MGERGGGEREDDEEEGDEYRDDEDEDELEEEETGAVSASKGQHQTHHTPSQSRSM